MSKSSISARQQDNLHPLGSLTQYLDHEVEPSIIGIDKRIVENERYRPPLLEKHVCKRYPGQYR